LRDFFSRNCYLHEWFFSAIFAIYVFFRKTTIYHKFLFLEKKSPKNEKSPKFLPKFARIAYNMRKGAWDFLLSYFENRQIWLNILIHGCHLLNITKLKNKNKNTDLDMSSSRLPEQSGILKISTLLPEL
jgi:hypothetical protein